MAKSSGSEEGTKALAIRKTERKMELANKQETMTPVRKKTSRAIKANSVALKVSRTKSTKVANEIGESTTELSNDRLAAAGNGGVLDGNSDKKRSSFIPRIHFSVHFDSIIINFLCCADDRN